jgi:glutamyl/glutaminyl-tRNA synthetase
VITRFAPSPTGYLHLGHVVNAIHTWGIAGAHGARVLLRIEDHDRIRSRPEYEAAILEDLAWLGFVQGGCEQQDRLPGGSREQGPPSCVRQSDRLEVYEQALASLRRAAHVYVCDCSRKEIGSDRYSGRCRDRALPEAPGRGLRVAIEPGVETFDDLRLGPQTQAPASQCGDLLLRDRDGNWTYQFAVTVDDLDQGVTLVIRGEDLLSSTGRQIRLGRMLGRATPPRFYHHPLIRKRGGEKLSKSSGDTGVRELRAAGLSAAEVVGRAAAAAGLLPASRPLPAAEVATLF